MDNFGPPPPPRAEIVLLPVAGQRQALTLGELVSIADRVPEAQVFAALQHHVRAADVLRSGGNADRESLRHMVIAATLLNRLIFDISSVPKDPTFRL